MTIGWISYENDYTFGVYADYLIYEHHSKQWWGHGNLHEKFEKFSPQFIKIDSFSSNFEKASYEEKVCRIKEYIAAGDIYQVNLTQRYESKVEADNLILLYKELRETSPAPMAAYLNIAGTEVLSSSPETYLRIINKTIESRPIKGTRQRFSDPARDQQSAEELLSSEKENAELIMITDLQRNDLGKVSEYGSIQVPELNQLESLGHVHHLISKVQGTLTQDNTHVDAIISCFPGGSITGAPKRRAMEIIHELEASPRGLYTGAIGYIGPNSESQFNIAIRTIVRHGEKLSYSVGSGIVADSDPNLEYQETLHKAKGIRAAIDKVSPPQQSP